MRYSAPGVFTQIIPVWIGGLGSRPKNSKSLNGFGLKNRPFVLKSAVGDSAKNFKRCLQPSLKFFYAVANTTLPIKRYIYSKNPTINFLKCLALFLTF
jgi:hypothetical protein